MDPESRPVADLDRQLVRDVLRKDRKATAEFVARYADCVYAYIRRRLLPRLDSVEDLLQETFLAAWQNLEKFRADGDLKAWLLGIAKHKVEDYYRRRLREFQTSEEGDDLPAEPSLVVNFDDRLEHISRHEQIQRILIMLPEHYALVLLWRYFDNRSVREMAEMTGSTEKSMERLLARAREQFKKRWQHVHH